MKIILCVGWLCVLGCGGEAFSVAVDAGAIQPLTLSPEAGAADDGQTPSATDSDAGPGAQEAGTILLEDAGAGEDAHPVMIIDAGDASPPLVCKGVVCACVPVFQVPCCATTGCGCQENAALGYAPGVCK